MKKRVSVHPVLIALFVLFLVAVMPWLLPLKHSSELPRDPASTGSTSSSPETQDKPAARPPEETSDPAAAALSLKDWMSWQAQRIGQPDENPEKTQATLKAKARSLNVRDIKDLENWVLETDRNGDERFLAVEMLVLNPRLESAESLGRILMTPESSRTSEPALENILRARAVEGLGAHPRQEATRILRDSLYRVSDRSLIDRGERALEARKRTVASPSEQDRQALGALLKKIR